MKFTKAPAEFVTSLALEKHETLLRKRKKKHELKTPEILQKKKLFRKPHERKLKR